MTDIVTNVPDWLVFIKVLTRGVRSMAAGSMCSAGNSVERRKHTEELMTRPRLQSPRQN